MSMVGENYPSAVIITETHLAGTLYHMNGSALDVQKGDVSVELCEGRCLVSERVNTTSGDPYILHNNVSFYGIRYRPPLYQYSATNLNGELAM